MKKNSYGQIMLTLLREHLIGARFAYTVHGTKVTNTQAALLSEIARRNTPSIEELCEVLKLHPSTISRTGKHLQKMGMIQSSRSRDDMRRMLHVCTAKGLTFAKFLWRMQQEIIAKRLVSFSVSERRQLESFLNVFAGDVALSRITPLRNEPRLAIIFRALTYDHGVVSGSYVGSGYSAGDWLILSEIHYNKRSPSELSRLVGVGKATLSLRLKSLRSQGLITSRKDPGDKRGRILTLTARGKRALQMIEQRAEGHFNQALEALAETSKIELGISLFEKYVLSLRRSLILAAKVVPIHTEDLAEIRNAARTAVADCGVAYPTSEYLLHQKNFVARIVADGVPEVFVECVKEPAGRLRLVNLFTFEKPAIPFSADELVEILFSPLGNSVFVNDAWREYLKQRAAATR